MSINMTNITEAMRAQLQADATIAGFLVVDVERGTVINEDPNRTPWLGVYRGKQEYVPRTLGSMNNWEVTPTIRLVLREASAEHATAVEDQMESHVQAVINAVLTDETIGGTVDMVTGFTVEYGYSEDDRSMMYFQTAIIEVSVEVATS